MLIKSVTVFGGAGFLGRYIIQKLAKMGVKIKVAVRNPDQAQFLKPLADVGTIDIVKINLHDEKSIKAAINGSDAVINTIGILYERRGSTFENSHVNGAKLIARASSGAKRLVHVSAICNSDSQYGASKLRGETEVLKHCPNATIIRPSVMFGAEDNLFNKIACLAKFSYIMPLFGGGHTKFQPVYVGDVAQAIVNIITDPAVIKSEYYGKIYELGGDKIYTLKEITEFALTCTSRKRLLIPVPFLFAKLAGFFLQYLPNPIITVDQVRLLKHDIVVNKKALGFKNLDINPTSVEIIVPGYIKRYCYNG